MSTFSGISTALSALQSHRKSMDVIGQNIANANTPGYVRQRAELQEVSSPGASSMFAVSTTTVGNGVTVSTISRAFDALMDARVNSRTADHALLSGRSATLSNLEGLTNEPGETGLASQLNEMWAAWNDAGTKAGTAKGDAAARAVVLGTSRTVVDSLRTAWSNTQQLWTTTRTQAQAEVLEVNAAAADIAKLNEQIQKAVAGNGSANELMDQRDALVTRVVELTGASTEPGPNGQVNVFLGGSSLVDGTLPSQLRLTVDPSATVSTATAAGVSLTFANGAAAYPASGALAARLEALTTTLPRSAAAYDQIAATVISQVNSGQAAGIRADGTAGPVLFLGTDARTITLANVQPADLALAAAGKGASDGSNAASVAALGTSSTGPDAQWATYVASLGAASASAAQRTTAARQTLTAAVTDQQGVTGVSLDEETANLIAAQRAYQGAARVLNAIDETLEVLMSIGR